MNYYNISDCSALMAVHEDGTVDVLLEMGFSNIMSNAVKFHAPEWYALEIKQNPKLEVEEINKDEFEQLLNEYFKNYKIIDFDAADIELYHGTDAKNILMSKEERLAHRTYCIRAIEYLYELFYEKYYDKELGLFLIVDNGFDDETEYEMIKSIDGGPLKRWQRYKNNHSLYDYPDNVIYLTYDDKTAYGYAKQSFAGGEIGYNAYIICKAAAILFPDLKPDKETAAAIEHVLEFGNQKREPVVLTARNIEIKYLKDENGESILNGNSINYRYISPNSFLEDD